MYRKTLLKENIPEICKSHFIKGGDKNLREKSVLQYMSKVF